MVLKGSFAAPCSEGVLALGPTSSSLSRAGEKTPMHDSSSRISYSPNHCAKNEKDIKNKELQRTDSENFSSQRFSQKQKRLDLEQDVNMLRRKLRHEEDIHRALERAFRRPVGSRPRFPPFTPPKTQELLAEVAVLEEEILRLEEQIVHLQHSLYQKTENTPSWSKQKEATSKNLSLRKSPAWSSLTSQTLQEGKRDTVVNSSLVDIPKRPDRNLGSGGLHKKVVSLGSMSEMKGVFFLTQAIDGCNPLYNEKGLEKAITSKSPKGHQKSSGRPNSSQEKENHFNIKDKNLYSSSLVSKGLPIEDNNLYPSSVSRRLQMEGKNLDPSTPVSRGLHIEGKKKRPSLSSFSKGLQIGDMKNLHPLSDISRGSHIEYKDIHLLSAISKRLHVDGKKNLPPFPPFSNGKNGSQKHSLFMQKAMEMESLTSKGKTGHISAITCFGPKGIPMRSALEDAKHIQPNKLSEEIMNCLLSIYLKLTRRSSAVNDTSPLVSRSSLSSVSLRSSGTRGNLCTKTPKEYLEEIWLRDPYGVCEGSVRRDIGPYKYFHDITVKSVDLHHFQGSASLLRRLRILLHKLCSADLSSLTYYQKLAFWINIYNACMMNAFLEHGIPDTPEKIVTLMCKAPLNVGGHSMSALAIEHFILRPPFDSKDAYLKNEKSGDKTLIQSFYGLEWPEPMVTFALCSGSRSSPAVHIYTASGVEKELDVAKKEYLQAAIGITATNKVLIPKLLEWYMRDFAKDTESLLEWVCEQLPTVLRTAVENCLKQKDGFISQAIEVLPYEFDFRYLLPS